jgi:DNA-binding MarR family transcriptional regulator
MTERAQAIDASADPETRVRADDHVALRLWLRLLTCTLLVERDIKAKRRERFSMTHARFDLMAQLERHPAGLKMNELSRRLMVSGGNVTGLTDQLVAEGLVERRAVPDDRRAFSVRLTAAGRRAFLGMAREHERWIVDLMDGLSSGERQRLYALLGRLKHAIASKEGA